MKTRIGIWLDRRQAYIIRINEQKADVETLQSEIEEHHVRGGARSKTPWGPMDVVSEKKHLERNNHQMQQYFDRIIDAVKDADELYIFGPAETKMKLSNAIEKDNSFSAVIRKTDTADSMTERQMIAQVREVFQLKPDIR